MERKNICKNIIRSIQQYITDPDKIEAHREKNHFIRKRKLSMLHIILYLFYSSRASMWTNISRICRDLPLLDFPKVTKQAVSKARQYIDPALFKELFYISVDLFYKYIPSRKKWHGYHLFAIDGSKFELPNSPSNFESFGEMFGYPDPSRKFTMGLASVVYDVLDDYIVHASFQRYLASERAAALEHLKSLERLNIYENSIVIFDRGYYSEALFRYCVSHNHLCLMRLKENYTLSKKTKGDLLTELPANPKENTESIPVRVLEVTLTDGSKEYLATNLFDKSITQDMFRELYFYRWPVETKYKELKSRLKIEEFNGATTVSVLQEFFLNILLSNIASLIKNDADTIIQKEIAPADDADTIIQNNNAPADDHKYQANRSYIIGEIKNLLPKILSGEYRLDILDELFSAACKHKSQIIDGRSFKRKRNKAIGRTKFRNKKPAF